MNLLRKIISYKTFLILAFFLILHALLFNYNVAEWGDSYRILRAAEFIRVGTYPEDEKRPPLFSFLLALRPSFIDPVTWGRVEVFIFSFAALYFFYRLVCEFIPEKKYQEFSLITFILNPVFLYWSIRIMSDILFTDFVLLVLLLLALWRRNFNIKRLIILGLLSGLAILTRFEGYLLTGAVLFQLFFYDLKEFNFSGLLYQIKKTFKRLIAFLIPLISVILPYFLYRSPFTSQYLEEPSGRTYDAKMVWIYIVSMIFSLGFVPAFYYIFKKFKSLYLLFKDNLGISTFLFLDLLLILLWPAAIPRLFMPIIPIFIVVFVFVWKLAEQENIKKNEYIAFPVLLVLLVVSQYVLKLQFLITNKVGFSIALGLQLILLVSLLNKDRRMFYGLYFIALLFWSFAVINLHKDTFISVKNAAKFASENYTGTFGYNDVSSVSDWYLNYVPSTVDNSGHYYNTEKKKNLEFNALKKANVDYLLITNEHNTSMTLDLHIRPYLALIKEFRYNVNGKVFFTEIVKFNKEWKQ